MQWRYSQNKQKANLATFVVQIKQVKYMSFLCVSVFLSFSFFRFLIKYFQLCICIVTILLPLVVNKAYQNNRSGQWIFEINDL